MVAKSYFCHLVRGVRKFQRILNQKNAFGSKRPSKMQTMMLQIWISLEASGQKCKPAANKCAFGSKHLAENAKHKQTNLDLARGLWPKLRAIN